MAKQEQKTEKRADKLIGRRYRYTADYQVVPALGPDGGSGKRVVYIGKWILPRCGEAGYSRLVPALWILTGFAVLAVLIAAQILPPPMEHKWYLPVLMISVFPLAYQVMGAFRLPARKKPMERQRYDKSFVRVGHSALFVFVLICAALLGDAAYWIVRACGALAGSASYSLRDGLFVLLLVLAAGAEFAAYRLFRTIQTDTLENSAYQP